MTDRVGERTLEIKVAREEEGRAQGKAQAPNRPCPKLRYPAESLPRQMLSQKVETIPHPNPPDGFCVSVSPLDQNVGTNITYAYFAIIILRGVQTFCGL